MVNYLSKNIFSIIFIIFILINIDIEPYKLCNKNGFICKLYNKKNYFFWKLNLKLSKLQGDKKYINFLIYSKDYSNKFF